MIKRISFGEVEEIWISESGEVTIRKYKNGKYIFKTLTEASLHITALTALVIIKGFKYELIWKRGI